MKKRTGPPASPISLSERQEAYLQELIRRHKTPQQQVKRARIILGAATGASNQELAQALGMERLTVRLWRDRWAQAAPRLAELEGQADEKELQAAIAGLLKDAYRPGAPPVFSPEQVVQIVALACEDPAQSGRPISHWTARELADEAVKRGIVVSISPQSVERFLKGGRPKAAPVTLLAQQQARG